MKYVSEKFLQYCKDGVIKPSWPQGHTLESIMTTLVECGCCPSIYLRAKMSRNKKGDLIVISPLLKDRTWRFHVNMSGNYWDDNAKPLAAAHRAIKTWVRGGCVLDGLAAPMTVNPAGKRT